MPDYDYEQFDRRQEEWENSNDSESTEGNNDNIDTEEDISW